MMIVNFPILFPCCFWICAIAWSLFQSFAGYRYGLFIFDSAYAETKDKKITPRPTDKVRQIAYGVHHGVFYFLCSLSGFIASDSLPLITEKIEKANAWAEISGGTGTILIALTLLLCLGVSGGLPRILFLGNRPV